MEALIFWVFGLLALVMGVLVVFHKNPISSALSLIVVLFCTSALYVLLQASFIAVIQVMVYAGAIMVLFVFVIMLLGGPGKLVSDMRTLRSRMAATISSSPTSPGARAAAAAALMP